MATEEQGFVRVMGGGDVGSGSSMRERGSVGMEGVVAGLPGD